MSTLIEVKTYVKSDDGIELAGPFIGFDSAEQWIIDNHPDAEDLTVEVI